MEVVIDMWIEENCECGLTESGVWSEEIFDRYGCGCDEIKGDG